jgi:MHS family citrate/tricarballylate:H+ symporter-like MFS transporter
MLTREQRKEKVRTVLRVASGNFLEMYDFMIFGYFSAAIGHAYFPASSDFASLMFSMTTFAVGFMIRPLGAIFWARTSIILDDAKDCSSHWP